MFRYDKSLNQGRGDRAPESQWDTVEGPLSIILVEGWMFGFSPLPDEDVAALNPDLVSVNKALRQYEAAWDSLVDSWIVIQVDEPDWVFQWRLQVRNRFFTFPFQELQSSYLHLSSYFFSWN